MQIKENRLLNRKLLWTVSVVILFFFVVPAYFISSSVRLINQQWVLVGYEIDGEFVEGPPFYSSVNFSFVPSNLAALNLSRVWMVRGTDGCNRFSAGFLATPRAVNISSQGKTNLYCEEVTAFTRVSSLPTSVDAGRYRYTLRAGTLTIALDDETTLVYSAR